MTKIGEGDKRWIVEERADGTNVHNWHWAEKDCLPWTKKRLAELLENIDILNGEEEGGMRIRTRDVAEVDGEAYVNIRKGKIIPGYEISVKLRWTGEAKDGSGNTLAAVDGTVDLPYIADENANDEEPEFKVSVREEKEEGSSSSVAVRRLREAFLAKGKPVILERIACYVKEMAAGGPAKELEGVAKAKSSNNNNDKPPVVKAVSAAAGMEMATKTAAAASDIEMATQTAAAAAVIPPPAATAKPKVKEGFRTITLSERFHCRPWDLYSVLLDEKRWRAFTQSAAKISTDEGGTFSIFNGAATGIHLQLLEDKLIVQRWRFSSWADGHYSNVCLMLEEPEIGVTVVKLTQTDVPDEDRFGNVTVVENTERGWRDLIFHKIRAVFGYGL